MKQLKFAINVSSEAEVRHFGRYDDIELALAFDDELYFIHIDEICFTGMGGHYESFLFDCYTTEFAEVRDELHRYLDGIVKQEDLIKCMIEVVTREWDNRFN